MTVAVFTQVDAFADRPFTGNPAAVIPLDGWLDDSILQAVAAENNLAETAFVVPATGSADYELRWFTPTVEVALCGHATLATGHVLLSRDPGRRVVRFRTRKSGNLEVRRAAGGGYELDLPAWRPSPKPLAKIAAAMGGSPLDTLWHDGGYSVIVYPDEAAIRALSPDFRALRSMGDILYIATARGTATDVVSRVFAPGAGIDEDPVTGAAHCVITPYWAERLGKDRFTAFQASARGGYLTCRLIGERAVLGGNCVTVIEGGFRLP